MLTETTREVRHQVCLTTDGTAVGFEILPVEGWVEVGADDVIALISDAIDPLVVGAAEILERLKVIGPDEIEVKFGVKVSGTASWVVAKAAAEGNFEVTLTWNDRTDGCGNGGS